VRKNDLFSQSQGSVVGHLLDNFEVLLEFLINLRSISDQTKRVEWDTEGAVNYPVHGGFRLQRAHGNIGEGTQASERLEETKKKKTRMKKSNNLRRE
jgi:hypothetical protein